MVDPVAPTATSIPLHTVHTHQRREAPTVNDGPFKDSATHVDLSEQARRRMALYEAGQPADEKPVVGREEHLEARRRMAFYEAGQPADEKPVVGREEHLEARRRMAFYEAGQPLDEKPVVGREEHLEARRRMSFYRQQ